MTFHRKIILSLLEQKIQVLVSHLAIFSYPNPFRVASISLYKFFLIMIQNTQLEIEHLV